MVQKIKILFVCLGNICRSPTAEGVFRKMVNDMELQDKFLIDSAGTAAYHIGKCPDPRSMKHALKRGYDIGHQKARRVVLEDFYDFDYILAMDRSNYEDLIHLCPHDMKPKLYMMLDYADKDLLKKINRGSNEVPDPYSGGEAGFEKVLDLLENACEGLLTNIQK
jgi:protein-tyrosine phosphatase